MENQVGGATQPGHLSGDRVLGPRQLIDRRSPVDRRTGRRSGPERRAGERRRAARLARAGLLALLALALPKADRPAPGSGSVEVISSDFRLGDRRKSFDDIIADAAAHHGVRPDLVRAVIQVESGFNPLAVSRVGALGLMQLMPRTAAHLGVRDPFDPAQNIFGGVKYLSMLLDRFNGNVALAVASYNAGPNAVGRFKGRIPPYRETRGYVKKVQAAQDDWLRESGEMDLEPFEIHPAMFYAHKVSRASLRARKIRALKHARFTRSASRKTAVSSKRKTMAVRAKLSRNAKILKASARRPPRGSKRARGLRA